MQSTTQAWKETMGCYAAEDRPRLLPLSYVEVRYTVNDPAAQADATPKDNGALPFVDISEVTVDRDKNYIKMATCEHNIWALDGTVKAKPDIYEGDTGFIGNEQCSDACTFTKNPMITVTFSKTHAIVIPGITVTWSSTYQEWARDFIVRAYNGGTLVHTYNVTGNTDVSSVVGEDVSGYDKIEVEVLKWCLPNRRARIEEIIVGVFNVFTKADLMSFSHDSSADLLSFKLPSDEITFELANQDGRWNPDNTQGTYRYLLEQQKVRARYGYKINGFTEWLKGGTFYMSEWNTPSNGITAKFTARSVFDLMAEKYALPSNKTMTLTALIKSAFTQCGISEDEYTVDSSLDSITVTLPSGGSGSTEYNETCASTVQLSANAACCVIRIDRSGIAHVEPLDETLTDYLIDQFPSYKNAEYKLSKPLKSVNVNDGQAIASNETSGEEQTVKNALIQSTDRAATVAAWVKDALKGRKTLNGEYRPDVRLDPLDKITVKNKYTQNEVYITSTKYTYNGAFGGTYEGRVDT